MKWTHYVKHKVKAVLVLMTIIVLMLIGNLSHRSNFDKLDSAVVSIYNDRLMPSTFIFQLTDHLYQKQLSLNKELYEHGRLSDPLNEPHDKNIAKLIKDYETTHLTAAERKEWLAFKYNLEHYMRAYRSVTNLSQIADPALRGYFNKAVQNLNALSAIQASEGKNLSKSSRDIISDGMLMSHFEISLLLVLGIFALMLVSVTDNKLLFLQHPHVLN